MTSAKSVPKKTKHLPYQLVQNHTGKQQQLIDGAANLMHLNDLGGGVEQVCHRDATEQNTQTHRPPVNKCQGNHFTSHSAGNDELYIEWVIRIVCYVIKEMYAV